MLPTRFEDWSAAAETAYESLSARCDKVIVAGLSMGGTLSLLLAEEHAEIVGLILVNPLAEQAAESFYEAMRQLLGSGADRIPGIGSDVAMPGHVETAYADTPIEALLSLMDGTGKVQARLAAISCPILLLSSRTDHVVPSSSGDVIVAGAGGPVERVFLERSYHVATIDYDQAEIEQRAVQFALKAFSA